MKRSSNGTIPYSLHQSYNIENILDPDEIQETIKFTVTAAWGLTDAIKMFFFELFVYRINHCLIAPINILERYTRLNNICIKWQSICDKWMKQPISEAVYSDLEQFKQSLYHIKSSLLLLQAWIPQNQSCRFAKESDK